MAYEGVVIAIFAAGLSITLSALGSFVGMGIVWRAYGGAVAESRSVKKFGKLLILQFLPCTQSIYGFLAMFWVMMKVGLLGTIVELTPQQGLALFGACMPMMIGNPISAIWQGKVAASGVGLVAKRPEEMGKAMIFAVIVETYAVLSLLATILLVNGIPVG